MKLRSDSFAARLKPAQKDELFAALVGGLGHEPAADQVRAWTGRKPSGTAVAAWYRGELVGRRIAACREVALVAEANCPADYSEQARRALGQAKFLAMLEDLTPRDIAAFEKNSLTERKLTLDEQRHARDTRVERLLLILERYRLIFERSRGGEKSDDLQQQIDLALEEIEKMKKGDDA